MERPLLFDRGEDGISQKIFEAGSPGIVQFPKCGDDAGRDLIDASGIGARERIERNDGIAGSVKNNYVVRPVLRDDAEDRISEVAVHVEDSQSPARLHVGIDLVLEKRRFPSAGRTDDIDVTPSIIASNSNGPAITSEEHLAEHDGTVFVSRMKERWRLKLRKLAHPHPFGGDRAGSWMEQRRQFFVREQEARC